MEKTLTEATLLFNDCFRKGTYGENYSTTPEIEKYNLHKLRHSIGVLEVGRQILLGKEFSNLNENLKKKSEIAFLLHDLGRFFQNNGERTLTNDEFEHGNKSAEIVEKYGYDNDIVLAIKYHNKKDYNLLFEEAYYLESNTLEQEYTVFLTRILRDADKLQNLLYILFSFDSIYKLDYNNYKKGGLSEKVLNDFINGKLITNTDRKTKADYLLSMISWGFDLEFISTYNILKNYNFFEFILEQLEKEFNIDKETLKDINFQIQNIPNLFLQK